MSTIDLKHKTNPYISYLNGNFSLFQRNEKRLNSLKYLLYGIVIHSGDLSSGHYTACVKARSPSIDQTDEFLQKELLECKMLNKEQWLIDTINKHKSSTKLCYKHACSSVDGNVHTDNEWYDISDTYVRRTTAEQVFKKQAYLLFYERVS